MTHLKKLWMARMSFKKQVTKCLLLPKDEFIVALMEQPDFLYLDDTKQEYNMICVINRSDLTVRSVEPLELAELANCLYYFERPSTNARDKTE